MQEVEKFPLRKTVQHMETSTSPPPNPPQDWKIILNDKVNKGAKLKREGIYQDNRSA